MAGEKKEITGGKALVFAALTAVLVAAAGCVLYAGYAFYRTNGFYDFVKGSKRGWTGGVHRGDAELGFAPVPGSRGEEIMPLLPRVPMRYDGEGFRVPVEGAPSSNARPLLLALGGSFTYGAAVRAEDTYPYIAAQLLGGTAKNAGVGSYGLAQMLILARRLVPSLKPDYLLVQYSPWLAARASTPFAPTYFGKMPIPFFYSVKDGLALYPPVFRPLILDLPLDRYRETPRGLADRLSFFWNAGLPLFVYEDFNMAVYGLKKAAGLVPSPAAQDGEVVKEVYSGISRLAEENGARLVIVILGDEYGPRTEMPFVPEGAVVVDAHSRMMEMLPVEGDDIYKRYYSHWSGPRMLVDNHPNGRAHGIIAGAVAAGIRAAASE